MNTEFAFVPLYWHIIAISLLLIIATYILVKDSSRYILLLLMVNIFGTMPQFFGYYFYDEFFTLILSISFILIHVQRKGYEELKQIFSKKYTIFIIFFSLYMSLQSIIGIIENEDIRILRWFIFYLGLIPLYMSVSLSLENSKINGCHIILLIFIYLFIYLLIGVYFDFSYNDKFSPQNMLVSGTSYAFFPILLLYIAMYLSIQKKQYPWKINNYIVVAFLIFLGMYFDSRLIQVSLIIWIFSLLSIKKYLLWMKMISIYTAVVIAYVVYQYTWTTVEYSQIEQIEQIEQIKGHIQPDLIVRGLITYIDHNIIGSFLVFFEDNGSDFTRSLQTEAMMNIANDSNIVRILFGYGVYSHRVLMAKRMNFLLNENLAYILISEKTSLIHNSRSDAGKESLIYRTNAFNAFMIDFGLVGLILLISLYIVLFKILIKQKDHYTYSIITILGLSFVWLFFSNILDMYLLYLMLIPGFINKIIKGKVEI